RRGVEYFVVGLIHEPDYNGGFFDSLLRGDLDVDPNRLTGLEGGLLTGVISDPNVINSDGFRPFVIPGVLFREMVLADYRVGIAVAENAAMLEKDRTWADFRDGLQIVRDEKQGSSVGDDGAHTVHAALLKHIVAHAENFIDYQYFGVDVSSDRKAESRVHTGR